MQTKLTPGVVPATQRQSKTGRDRWTGITESSVRESPRYPFDIANTPLCLSRVQFPHSSLSSINSSPFLPIPRPIDLSCCTTSQPLQTGLPSARRPAAASDCQANISAPRTRLAYTVTKTSPPLIPLLSSLSFEYLPRHSTAYLTVTSSIFFLEKLRRC